MLTCWITSIAQVPECCLTCSCTTCEDLAECQNSPFTPETFCNQYYENDPFGAGCGIEATPCSEWYDNSVYTGTTVDSYSSTFGQYPCVPYTNCNDPSACNFLPSSLGISDCIYPDECEDCSGACLNDVNANGICDCFETVGCTDAAACNYNADATLDDGSCTYPEEGFNCDGTCSDDDGDGVCLLDEIYGCTDSVAVNYYPIFTEDDGGCIYAVDLCDCPADMNGDSFITVADILVVLGLFEYSCE